MSTPHDHEFPAVQPLRPLVAALTSLAAVSGFSVLLGVFFLPTEAQQLKPPQHVTVTHVLPPRPNHNFLSLHWSIPERGIPGWKHHLSIGDIAQRLETDDGEAIVPLSISRIPTTPQALLGNWDGSLYTVDTSRPGLQLQMIGRQQDGGVVQAIASHDGNYAISYSAFSLYGWDLRSRRELWRREDLPATCMQPRFDGNTALVAQGNGELWEIDFSTGNTVGCLAHMKSPILSIGVSPCGAKLGIVMANGDLQIWDSGFRKAEWIVRSGWHLASGRFVSFSPDGRFIVSTDSENPSAIAVWDLAEQSKVMQLPGHAGIVLGADFAANGTLWSWGTDGTIRTWDIRSGSSLTVTEMSPG